MEFLETSPDTLSAPNSDLHNDFRTLVEGGWINVDPIIRERMDLLLTSSNDTVFEGVGCVRRSFVGFLFAQLARLFGSPLVFNRGENVKTSVRVAPTKNGLRCWHRSFTFEDGTEQLVQTSKIVTPNMGLMDAVGAQGEKTLRTKMRIWTSEKSLCFESTGYFLKVFNLNIPIPMIFTPGKLFAEHRDEGTGSFRYILALRHPVWGETFYQDGLFKLVD